MGFPGVTLNYFEHDLLSNDQAKMSDQVKLYKTTSLLLESRDVVRELDGSKARLQARTHEGTERSEFEFGYGEKRSSKTTLSKVNK